MKKTIFIILMVAILKACTSPSPIEQELRQVINKPLNIEMFDSILHCNSVLTMKQLRENYKYISIVYLQEGCTPCFPKFRDWHLKMDSIYTPSNYTVLFIFGGEYNGYFNSKESKIANLENRYYTIVDSKFAYLNQNSDIPRWIVDSSLLIDQEKRIKMVGAPWVNEDMKNLFYETVNNEQ